MVTKSVVTTEVFLPDPKYIFHPVHDHAWVPDNTVEGFQKIPNNMRVGIQVWRCLHCHLSRIIKDPTTFSSDPEVSLETILDTLNAPKQPHVDSRADRELVEILWPSQLAHKIAQVNYVKVSEEGQKSERHFHETLMETFLVLEGQMDILVQYSPFPKWFTLTPYQSVTIPSGISHRFLAAPDTRYLILRSEEYLHLPITVSRDEHDTPLD